MAPERGPTPRPGGCTARPAARWTCAWLRTAPRSSTGSGPGAARHLRRADTPRTAEALRLWWQAWAPRLPGAQATLTGLSEAELIAAGQAYAALRAAPAAGRAVQGRDVAVAFGDTAAAKALYAIRPQAFLPWDAPIRLAFGPPGGGAAYVRLLRHSAEALDGLARRLGTSVSDLPELLGRPESSPPKLVDEFLWIRITRQS